MLYFFINPASRSGKGAIQWEKTKKYLKQNKIPYEAHFLKASISPRPVMETIFEKEQNKTVSIVLIGGDGTINQCVNAVPDLNRLELSVIPTGSGNDFCRNKPIPTSLDEQIQNILQKKNHMYIDRGMVTYHDKKTVLNRCFMVSTGMGYDADICYMADKSKLKKVLNRIKLGKLVYVIIGIKGIFDAELTDMEVTIDGETKQYSNVFFIATMNQPFEGGGVAMTPNASDTDGELDFLIFHGVSKLKALMTIPLLYIKKHEGKAGVTLLRGKEIKVTSSAPRILHFDGESREGTDMIYARIDGKVHFIY